jgi:hypothetical protein
LSLLPSALLTLLLCLVAPAECSPSALLLPLLALLLLLL